MVWPFEVAVPDLPAGEPGIVHAEIWPSVAPFDHETGTCADEQQVRAVVQYWRLLDRADRLDGVFATAPDRNTVRREEGWILGVPPTQHNRPPTRVAPSTDTVARREDSGAPARPPTRQTRWQRSCECGCGAEGPGRFRPGHDAKLRSLLLKRIAAGDADAAERLTALGWH